MEIWEITNTTATVNGTTQTSYRKSNSGVASEYSKILAEKISNIKEDVRKMDAVKEQLDEICNLQEELTGEVKIDEDSGNANRDGGNVSIISNVETIKRFMPDGSIMITTYEGGRITEQIRQRPHMVAVPDYTAPPKPDGTVATKLEAKQDMDLASLLMM